MTPDEYIVDIKTRFGEQRTKDGVFVRDMDDRELMKRMLTRYPGDRDSIIGLESYLGELPPELPKSEVQKKMDDNATFQGFFERVKRSATERNENVRQIKSDTTGQGVGRLAEGVLRTAGQVAGLAGDVAVDFVAEGLKPEVKEGIKSGIQTVAESAPAQHIAKSYGTFKEANPNLAKDLEAVVNIGSILPVGTAAKPAIKGLEKGMRLQGETVGQAGKELATGAGVVKEAVADTTQGLVSRVKNIAKPTLSEKGVADKIVAKYEKAVKPSIAGKKSATQIANYRDDVVTAVDTIKQNKANLQYADDGADDVIGAISGETPKSLSQFAQAIEQTKKKVFADYDELAKIAGREGVTVDLNPIAKELDTVINSKALKLTNPRAIQYAKNMKDRYAKMSKLDAQTAQDVIQNYNKSLEAFYRNPSYDSASNAAIDAMIANRVRAALDEGISGLTGVQYQALKNQYGALKAIEKDVVKAAMRDANRNVKGLIDYSDILSGGQVVSGIATLNPALIMSGATQYGIKMLYKNMVSPNRAVRAMFETAEESFRKTTL